MRILKATAFWIKDKYFQTEGDHEGDIFCTSRKKFRSKGQQLISEIFFNIFNLLHHHQLPSTKMWISK
ncbi:hypothetical protein GDO81_019768 [Engystomops pustulosus]|uniref:Uncharacterized protein n=1 Tax=Engystomops pustulosus TaxID=76066 RepID=A0AAV6ZFC6_ENGPU|nr:hypothetical protein GDO81_019768 [Engystomops pustulosus]